MDKHYLGYRYPLPAPGQSGRQGVDGGSPPGAKPGGAPPIDKRKNPCRYQATGTCTQGNACPFMHKDVGPPAQPGAPGVPPKDKHIDTDEDKGRGKGKEKAGSGGNGGGGDPPGAPPPAKSFVMCHFSQEGRCMFGDECSMKHGPKAPGPPGPGKPPKKKGKGPPPQTTQSWMCGRRKYRPSSRGGETYTYSHRVLDRKEP